MADVTSEALAGMAKQGRTPMGKDGIKFSTQGPKAGKLVPKTGNAKAGDPTGAGTKVNRQNAMPTQAERNGAAYRPMTVRYTKQTDPSAGFTQANGNIIKTAVYRSRPNFDGGSSSSY
jgi:hypothetical protein